MDRRLFVCYDTVCFLFYSPDIIGLKQFGEGVVGLLGFYFFNLSGNAFVVGGTFHVAYYAEGNREVWSFHHSQLELQGVVLTVGVVNKQIFLGYAILAYLDYLHAKSFLHNTIFIILTKDHWLAVLQVDSVFGAAFFGVDGLMGAIVEDDAVLQYLAYGSTLMLLSRLEYFYCAGGVGSYGACKELAPCAEAEFSGAEGVFHSAIGA